MHCPVCGGDRFAVSEPVPEVGVHECVSCGLLLSDVRSTPSADEFARIDDDRYHAGISAVRQIQSGQILAMVAQHRDHGGDWLDVGCSFGFMLDAARGAGYRILGIEPDERAAAAARALLGGDAVVEGLFTPESRPLGSADVISALEVLEHIEPENTRAFVDSVRVTLRPGGLVVLKVPCQEGMYFSLSRRLPKLVPAGAVRRLWQSDYEYPHRVYWTAALLRRFLADAGFDVVATKYIPDLPNRAVLPRLRMDDTIPAWQAFAMAPAFYALNVVEQRIRRKSDFVVVIARRPSDN